MNDCVPTEGQMETAWCQYAHAVDASLGRLREDDENPSDEFDRFISRVREEAREEGRAEFGLTRANIRKIKADTLRSAAGQFRGSGEVRDEIEAYLYRSANRIEDGNHE